MTKSLMNTLIKEMIKESKDVVKNVSDSKGPNTKDLTKVKPVAEIDEAIGFKPVKTVGASKGPTKKLFEADDVVSDYTSKGYAEFTPKGGTGDFKGVKYMKKGDDKIAITSKGRVMPIDSFDDEKPAGATKEKGLDKMIKECYRDIVEEKFKVTLNEYQLDEIMEMSSVKEKIQSLIKKK